MGLFGGKTILVSSTVYNMAGPEVDRVNYLRSLVASNVISNSKFSMPDTISSGYLNGPGIKARRFFRWALNNYENIGIPTVSILNRPDWDIPAIRQQMPEWAGAHTIQITEIRAGVWEASYFAEAQIMVNNPGALVTNLWTMDVNTTTNQITVHYNNGVDPDLTFSYPPDTGGTYLYISYVAVDDVSGLWSPRLYIYEVGSGNTVLDAAPIMDVPEGSFFPVIPIRVDNQFLSETYKPEAFALAKRAYRKATGQSYSKLVDTIADNESLGDIDHCWMVYGVSLNCLENSSRRYLFKFFEYLMPYTQKVFTDYNSWLTTDVSSYSVTKVDYRGELASYEGDADASYTYVSSNNAPYYPSNKPLTSIQLQTTGVGPYALQYHVTMRWSTITKITGTGLKEPGRKKGECWLTTGSTYDTGSGAIVIGNSVIDYTQEDDDVIEIHWQKGDDYWETLQIVGLKHINKVYADKAVEITAKEALADTDESGFIVPLHYETFRSMSLIDSTQMFTASAYLVFNSYQVVKQKWYQTWAFKIILVVAIVAITVATGGIGGASAGLLGTNAAVGATLGFTGMAAVVAGAIANALVAMIVLQIISKVSVMIFGDKLGAIIGAIAATVAMTVGAGLMSGQSMSAIWGNMMSAQNLIGLTSSVGSGIQGYLQASAMEYAQKSKDLLEDYQKQSRDLTEKYLSEFGYNISLDPVSLFTDVLTTETLDSFLSRTMMTGSDIADMSLDMVTNFSDLTLSLDLKGK